MLRLLSPYIKGWRDSTVKQDGNLLNYLRDLPFQRTKRAWRSPNAERSGEVGLL